MGKLAPNDHEKTCQRVAITGLGGIGKTQIALEAAFQIQERYPDCSVFCVSAVNSTSFEASYREIGQALQVAGINDDKANTKLLVKEYLGRESAGRWLFIVDNADDLELLDKRVNEDDEGFDSSALADYLPFSQRGSILFTTRNHEAAVNQAGVDVVTVREMSETESLRLLETSLIDTSLITRDENAQELLQLLTHLPLAIKQAAAFINQKQMSISDYIETCKSNNQEFIRLLSKDFEDQGRYRSIKNPIALTWLISFRKIQQYDRVAAEYLYFMSCVAQQDIPYSLLPPASNSKESIGTLKAYAFITRKGGNSYDIHRLVQIAVRNWLKTTGELTRWSCKALKQVARIFPFFTHENRDECTLYLPQVQRILRFEEIAEDDENSLSILLFNIGEYFLRTGKYNEAEAACQQALQLNQKVLGTEHPSTLDSMNSLAVVLYRQGRYDEAEAAHRQTLQLMQKVLGTEHPSTLGSMHNLALVLDSQGRYDEAEVAHRQTLQLKQKILGTEHPNTLDSMNSLAVVLYRQGRYDEAEAAHRQTLQLMQKVLGAEHPSTLNSMKNLAIVLEKQGRCAEAEGQMINSEGN